VRQTFWVPGPLPGQNEIIAAAKSGRGKGNAFSRQKSAWTNAVSLRARAARIGPFPSPVTIECVWREPSARRDPDNVCAGIKFVLDGLVEANVIHGDGRKHIAKITHEVETMERPGGYPGVYVTIESTE